MNPSRDSKLLALSIDRYEQRLNDIPEELFTQNPAEGQWSYAEVYSHLFSSNLLSLKAAEKCIEGTAEKIKEGPAFNTRLVLWAGRLPKGKFKVPQSLQDRVKKISREESRLMISKTREKILLIKDRIQQAAPDQKIKHPRLGYLNAPQWLRFVLIHSNHHLKQLERIDRVLKKS